MPSKPVILTPTTAQIEQLRAAFFERLDRDGAPCEGILHGFFFLSHFHNFS